MSLTWHKISLLCLMIVWIEGAVAGESAQESTLKDQDAITWAADLDCAQRRYPAKLFEDTTLIFLKVNGHSADDIRNRTKKLINLSATHQQTYKARSKQCPNKRSDPRDLSRTNKIYQEVQCMALQGLSRRDWQQRVQGLYRRHKISQNDYVSASMELLEDPVYQVYVRSSLATKCPSKIQKKRLILERRVPLRNGRYTGAVDDIGEGEISLEILVENKTIVSAAAQAFGRKWPLRARTSGSKMSLSGKDGPRTLFFDGRMRSGMFRGRFYARIGSRDIKGRWTAKRTP